MDNNNRIKIINEKLKQPGYINVQNRMEIASLINDLEPEVAQDIVNRFPEVKDLTIKAIDNIKDVNEKILENNESSFTEYYKNSNQALNAFKIILENPNASIEEKKLAAENIQKLLDRDDKKDDKIRENNNKVLKIIGEIGLLALGITMVSLGVKISFKPIEISDNKF